MQQVHFELWNKLIKFFEQLQMVLICISLVFRANASWNYVSCPSDAIILIPLDSWLSSQYRSLIRIKLCTFDGTTYHKVYSTFYLVMTRINLLRIKSMRSNLILPPLQFCKFTIRFMGLHYLLITNLKAVFPKVEDLFLDKRFV